MKWICDDKLVRPPRSTQDLEKYLKNGYLRVENGDWNFIQVVLEKNNIFYVEIQKGKNERQQFELQSSERLWNLVAQFDVEISKSCEMHTTVNGNLHSGICHKIFIFWIFLSAVQLLLFAFFYYIKEADIDPVFNVFGAAGWIATSFAVRSERFFMRFDDASLASSPMNFWITAFFGFVFGGVFIALSYIG